MVIQHNLPSIFTNNQLGIVTKNKEKVMEKLSSGYKINRAADNAAGLSITEKFRAQIRGLDRGQMNLEDGISYCNVADGALNEVSSMLTRIKELSVQAANDTNTDSDRGMIDKEVQHLKEEINSIFVRTEFNTMSIWQAAYVPDAGGTCTDFSLYNVQDGTGSYYGGIIYMGHRYSWQDLGMEWDQTTHTFQKTTSYEINVSDLHNNGENGINSNDSNTVKDDYLSYNNEGAQFKFYTTAGKGAVEVEKSYSWKAGEDGLYIDGVITKGVATGSPPQLPVEGNTTWEAMGITKNAPVPGGTYTFLYYGMEVSFDVPEGGEDSWESFLKGFSNPRVKLNWTSKFALTEKKEVAQITAYDTRIDISSSNKDYISRIYNIRADETGGIWVENSLTGDAMKDPLKTLVKDNSGGDSTKLETLVEWSDLPETTGGNNNINSWGIDAGSGSQTSGGAQEGDKQATFDSEGIYRYQNNNLNLGVDLTFDFNLLGEASRTAVIDDLNYSRYSGSIASPVKVDNYTAGSGAFQPGMASTGLSFETQRWLGRAFASYTDNAADCEAGGLTRDAVSGRYMLTLDGTMNNLTMLSTNNMEDFEQQISDKITERLAALYPAPADPTPLGLGMYNLQFTNGADFVNLQLDLSGITYQQAVTGISAAGGIDNYVENNMDIFLANASFELNGAGQTYQNLSLQQNTVYESVIENRPAVDGFVMSLTIQSGANGNDGIEINYDYMRLGNLGIKADNVQTAADAARMLKNTDEAIVKLSRQRSVFGAYTNRMQHAYEVNGITSENMQNAESKMRDADMAKEMMNYWKHNVLEQAGQTVLAQANQSSQGVMVLLRS